MSKLHFYEFVLMLHEHLDEDAFVLGYMGESKNCYMILSVTLDLHFLLRYGLAPSRIHQKYIGRNRTRRKG